MLALVRWLMKWDFKAADKSYRRALELDPRNVYAAVEYADLLRETSRTTEAAELIRRSRALLPALPQLAVKEAEIQLDLGRPAGHGFLVLERLNKLGYLHTVPVIVLSARDPATFEERALKAGATAFFQKPADNNELLNAIRTSLHAAEA